MAKDSKKQPKKPPAKEPAAKNSIVAITTETVIRKLLIQGYSLPDICRITGLTRPKASKVVEKIYADFRERSGAQYEKLVAEQIGRIEQVEQAAWLAWDDSKTQKWKERTKTENDEKGETIQNKIRYERAPGNPKFLNILMNCIAERSKLLGLNARPEDETNVDEVPIVAVVIGNRGDKKRIMDAEKFFAVNTVDGLVVKDGKDGKDND